MKKIILTLAILATVLILGCTGASKYRGNTDHIDYFEADYGDDGYYKFTLGLYDKNEKEITDSGHIKITVKDNNENIIYIYEKDITDRDFSIYEVLGMGFPKYYIRVSPDEFQDTSSTYGTAFLTFTNKKGTTINAEQTIYFEHIE